MYKNCPSSAGDTARVRFISTHHLNHLYINSVQNLTYKMVISGCFFWFPGTGSCRKWWKVSKFNSAHQELSIEVHYISVSQSSPELANLPHIVAITYYATNSLVNLTSNKCRFLRYMLLYGPRLFSTIK